MLQASQEFIARCEWNSPDLQSIRFAWKAVDEVACAD
jgi:hypothetical protein